MRSDHLSRFSLVRRVESLEDRITPASTVVAELLTQAELNNAYPASVILDQAGGSTFVNVITTTYLDRFDTDYKEYLFEVKGIGTAPTVSRILELPLGRNSFNDDIPRTSKVVGATEATSVLYYSFRGASYVYDPLAPTPAPRLLTDGTDVLTGFSRANSAQIGGDFYFTAQVGAFPAEIYRVSLATPGAAAVRVSNLAAASVTNADNLIAANGRLYFTNSTNLYTFDPSTNTASQIRDAGNTPVSLEASAGLAATSGLLFYSQFLSGPGVADPGSRLGYVNTTTDTATAPTSASTIIASLRSKLTAYGERVFFGSTDPVAGDELGFIDAAAPGVVRVIDINPGMTNGTANSGLTKLVGLVGDTAYVTATSPERLFDNVVDPILSVDLTSAMLQTTLVDDRFTGVRGSTNPLLPTVDGALVFQVDSPGFPSGPREGIARIAPGPSAVAEFASATDPRTRFKTSPYVGGTNALLVGNVFGLGVSLHSVDLTQREINVTSRYPYSEWASPELFVATFGVGPISAPVFIDVDLNDDGDFDDAGEAAYGTTNFVAGSPRVAISLPHLNNSFSTLHDVRARTTDSGGNAIQSASTSTRFGAYAPTLSLDLGANSSVNVTARTSMELTLKLSFSFTVDGGAAQAATLTRSQFVDLATLDFSTLAPGSHTISVTVTASNGATTTKSIEVVVPTPTTPPGPDPTPTPIPAPPPAPPPPMPPTAPSAGTSAVAPGVPGSGQVIVANPDGTRRTVQVLPPGTPFTIKSVSGDLTGDGSPEIATIIADGPTVVQIFGADGRLISVFFALPPGFTGGGDIAVAGNRIAVSAGPGGVPVVQTFDVNGNLQAVFFVEAPDYTGGVFIAAGDFDGDGTPEIITAARSGTGPIRIFDLAGKFVREILPFGGAPLAIGSLTAGNGFIAYVTPAGLPPVAYVEKLNQGPTAFYAAPPTFTNGVQLTTETNPRGVEKIVAAPKGIPAATGVYDLAGALESDLSGIGIVVG